jgi:hypothetical protein
MKTRRAEIKLQGSRSRRAKGEREGGRGWAEVRCKRVLGQIPHTARWSRCLGPPLGDRRRASGRRFESMLRRRSIRRLDYHHLNVGRAPNRNSSARSPCTKAPAGHYTRALRLQPPLGTRMPSGCRAHSLSSHDAPTPTFHNAPRAVSIASTQSVSRPPTITVPSSPLSFCWPDSFLALDSSTRSLARTFLLCLHTSAP